MIEEYMKFSCLIFEACATSFPGNRPNWADFQPKWAKLDKTRAPKVEYYFYHINRLDSFHTGTM